MALNGAHTISELERDFLYFEPSSLNEGNKCESNVNFLNPRDILLKQIFSLSFSLKQLYVCLNLLILLADRHDKWFFFCFVFVLHFYINVSIFIVGNCMHTVKACLSFLLTEICSSIYS